MATARGGWCQSRSLTGSLAACTLSLDICEVNFI
jgi:hypothetical protein